MTTYDHDLGKVTYTYLALITLGIVMLVVVRVKDMWTYSLLSTHFSLVYIKVIFVAIIKSQLSRFSSHMKNLHRLCFQPILNCVSEAGLAEWKTKDSKPLAIKYCRGCNSRRNSQSHRRVHWKVGPERSNWAAVFPLGPLPHRQCHSVGPPWRIPKAPPLTR